MMNVNLALANDTLRELGAVDLAGIPVEKWRTGPETFFSDHTWIPEGTENVGRRAAHFSAPLPQTQVSLTDPGYEGLLLDCKLLVWSVGYRADGNSTGTLAKNHLRYLRALFGWMVRENLPDLSYVTRDRVWADGCLGNPHTFASFLLGHLGGDPDEVVNSTVMNYLNEFSAIFMEHALLEAFGRAPLPEHPFMTGENNWLANELGRKEMEEWRPVPDEVQIPLLNASEDWLGQKAEDVLGVLERYLSAWNGHRERAIGTSYAHRLARIELANFRFSMVDREEWHQPLDKFTADNDANEDDLSSMELGRLVRRVQTAAMIAIQQSSGMRSGELTALPSRSRDDGTPACIEERTVAQGSKSLVLIHSVTSKVNGGIPEAHEWVVGVKPVIPFGVAPDVRAQRAVDVALRLGNLLKSKNTSPDVADLLFVNWSHGSVPTDGSKLIPFSNQTHNEAIRRFLADTCHEKLAALPDDSPNLVQDGWLGQWRDSMGGILHSHQLRKSFANFAYSAEPGLKEEIRIQYGHVSLAMTSRYTNNERQVKQMNEMEAQLAAEHIVAALSQSALAGKGAEEIQLRGEWKELRCRFESADPETRHEVVTEWLLETRRLVDEEYRVTVNGARELRKARRSAVSDAPHGLCAAVSIHGTDMECRKDGKSTDSLLDGLGADKRYRTPSRCLGCINYLVLPKHRPFWEDRFRRSAQAVAFMKVQGQPASMYAVQKRSANQSRQWLRAIGVTENELNAIAANCERDAERRIAGG